MAPTECLLFTSLILALACYAQTVDKVSMDVSGSKLVVKVQSRIINILLPKKMDEKYLYYHVEKSIKNPNAIDFVLWRIVPLEKYSEMNRSLFELKSWYAEIENDNNNIEFVNLYTFSCWGNIIHKRNRSVLKIDSMEGFGKLSGLLEMELISLK